MNFLKKLFNLKPKGYYLTILLNDKITPISRGYLYENPLDEKLKALNFGEVTGGGTYLEDKAVKGPDEVNSVDIEIFITSKIGKNDVIMTIIQFLESIGVPKGSKIEKGPNHNEVQFGNLEGMAVYLDGVNLSKEVYKNSDPNILEENIKKLCNIKSDVVRSWQGNSESAIYFYSDSFNKMSEAIKHLVETRPDFVNSRIVQIA